MAVNFTKLEEIRDFLLLRHEDKSLGQEMIRAINELREYDKLKTKRMSRTEDPDTSKQAADRASKELKEKQMKVLRAFQVARNTGRTTTELDQIFAQEWGHTSTARTRRAELRDMGYVEETSERRANHRGNMEIVWRITRDGELALTAEKNRNTVFGKGAQDG